MGRAATAAPCGTGPGGGGTGSSVDRCGGGGTASTPLPELGSGSSYGGTISYRSKALGAFDDFALSGGTLLAWNAVATKVNTRGQVEGTCVGTGMAFDPAFYYHRPTSPFAAHGYGPVLLAGAEVINFLKTRQFEINDSSVQVKPQKGTNQD